MPSALLDELFPSGTASSALYGFVTTQAFQPLMNLIGEKYVFWLCATVLFSSVPFVFYYLPGTMGKSLLEIQNTLAGKKLNLKTSENSV